MDALGEALDQARDADLVDHFCQLAGAGRSQPLAHPRIGTGDDRLGALIGVLVAAAHDRQHAVLRAGLAAGDGTVDEFEAGLLGGRIQLARDVGGSGGVVDEGRALLHAGKGAVGADRDRAQIVVVADAAHHEILALGGGLRGRGGLAAELLGPLLRLGRGAVVDGDLMATLFDEVSCHGETHDAETEKCDFGHICYLVFGAWAAGAIRAGGFGGSLHHTRCAAEGNGFVGRRGGDLC